MNKMVSERKRKLAEKVIRGLESRNMEGYYAETKEEALKIAFTIDINQYSIFCNSVCTAEKIIAPKALKFYASFLFRRTTCISVIHRIIAGTCADDCWDE